MRRLLPLALVLCGLTANAAEVYRLIGELPAEPIDARVRELATGTTLLIAADGADLDPSYAERLRLPAGHEPYLVELHRNERLRQTLDGLYPIAYDDGEYVVYGDLPNGRSGDILRLCRERLRYFGKARSQTSFTTANKRAADPALKRALVDDVGSKSFTFRTRIGELSGEYWAFIDGLPYNIDNRYTHGNDHLEAVLYITDRLENFGYTVTQQNFSVSGSPTQNLLAVKTGTTYPNEIIVVGAHYDAISEAVSPGNPDLGKAPGAEDNASGTSGVLLLAELFANLETERTIHFIAFGGEEQGLHGSQYYVSQAIANNDNVIGALTMDMIANWSSNYKVIIEGETPWEWLMAMYEQNVIDYTNIGYRKDYVSFGSDHVPFQDAGIPAFLAIDWDYPTYVAYHQSDDELDLVEEAIGVEIVKAMAATLADLSGASDPATPAPAVASSALLPSQPNPFNPSTTIRLEVGNPGRVRLEIFDVAGRRVRQLMDEAKPAGLHELMWDGRDDAGQTLASGSYLLRMEHVDGSHTQRLTLVK